MRPLLTCLTTVALLMACASGMAAEDHRAVGAIDDGNPRVEVELVVDVASAAPGAEVRVGALLEIDPDWHVYWRNSGESGLSTEFSVDSGLANVGPMMWPAPHLFVDKSGEVATFGYAERVLFWRSATLPDDAAGRVEIVATIDYLACKIDCIPGRHELRRTIEVGEPKSAPFPDELADRAPLKPSELGLEVEVAFSRADVRPGETLTAQVSLRCAEETCETAEVVAAEALRYTFIPDVTPGLEWKTTDVTSLDLETGTGTTLALTGRASRDDFEDGCELAGVVWVGASASRVPVEIRRELPCSNEPRGEAAAGLSTSSDGAPGSASPAPTPAEKPSLVYILLLALLGGMILNLMPCVFPVLAVKVFSFVKLAHENQSDVLRHSGAYAAGILATMLALAAVVIGLKAAGSNVGWGFQFQEPLFIAFLASALVLFALNLFGVFEVTVGSGGLGAVRKAEFGLKRSFGEGVLAVVLATPCSAPFLGTAVGFAFSADSATIVAVFLALGVGLALPFAVLTAIPSWAKLLPKPGDWMMTFKQLLGFALLGTVVWLAWVLGQSLDSSAVASLLAFLVAISMAAWAWGKVQFGMGGRKWITAAFCVAIVAGTGWVALDFDEPGEAVARPAGTVGGSGPSSWPAYDEETVRTEVEGGAIVFVDFTADWCITCKVNERGVLSSDETAELFADNGVKAYVADWTRKDDRIRDILGRHGKAGVPMYLLYTPGNPDAPQVLPELLTEQVLREAVAEAKSRAN